VIRRFKVVLVDFDGNTVAGWVGEALAKAAIALAQGRWPRSCVNRAVKPRWNLS